MTPPKPGDLFVLHASATAAWSSAFAPLFGNDSFEAGVLGLAAGVITGLPFYLDWLVRQHVRNR